MTDAPETECPFDLPPAKEFARIEPVIEKYETALLMMAGFVGFSVCIGVGYNAVRRFVFRDFHNLDVVFDAGGRVSLSLTAVTVTSQLLWPADFLQSPTLASKVGVSGCLWYTTAIVLSVLMFPVLCIQLKTRAPGAKTFPQIAYARFGKPTHVLFCIIALFTNLVITSNLILAGKAAVEILTKDTSNEFIVLVLAAMFGSYCLIGGLGTTFYISYFNTALLFICSSIFILDFTYLAEPSIKEVASSDVLYETLSCLKGPEGNAGESFLTYRSESGIIYAISTLFMTIAIMFCDQANWQSRIAAKPREGIIGFLIAGFLWFALPTSFSFVMSMTYKSMSFKNGMNLLSDEQIDEGYISPYVVQTLLGKKGSYLLLTLLTMTLMSTGSGEVMSVSSVLVYDIIKIYIRPFRPHMKPTDCPLCGEDKVGRLGAQSKCYCPSATDCSKCAEDLATARNLTKYDFTVEYKCQVHGKYRHYENTLIHYKSWCMVAIVVCIVPLGLLIIESGMNLNWTFLAAQVFIAPFLIPLFFTIAWAGATAEGLISGGILGLVAAIAGMLGKATTYEGGLSDFYTNTAQDWSILTGLLAGCGVSLVLSVSVSLLSKAFKKRRTSLNMYNVNKRVAESLEGFQNDKDTKKESESFPNASVNPPSVTSDCDIEWQKTMTIDNPLNPFRDLYKEELATISVGDVVTSRDMEKIFKISKRIAYVAAAVSFSVFLIVIPSVALSHEVLTSDQFSMWISVCQHWCLIGTFLVVFIPPGEEVLQIWRQYKKNKANELADSGTET